MFGGDIKDAWLKCQMVVPAAKTIRKVLKHKTVPMSNERKLFGFLGASSRLIKTDTHHQRLSCPMKAPVRLSESGQRHAIANNISHALQSLSRHSGSADYTVVKMQKIFKMEFNGNELSH